MCPPGYHVVRGHDRVCKSGTSTWVDEHVRRNHGRIAPGLLIENIHFLFWNTKRRYEPLSPIFGFKSGAEYDSVIQFWLEYWKEKGVSFPEDLDPLMIKALIAIESSFNPQAKSRDPKSTASGLMQVTDQALRVLGGFPIKAKWIEAKKHLIHVEKADKVDPVVNIALGIRLLGHKYSQTPKKFPKNAKGALIGYHQWNKEGEAYADGVLALYNKSLKKP